MHEVRKTRPILHEPLDPVGVDGCTMNVTQQLRDCQHRLTEVALYGVHSGTKQAQLMERIGELMTAIWEIEGVAEALKDDIHKDHGSH